MKTVAQPGPITMIGTHLSPNLLTSLRLNLFSLLINFWPLLLVVSQKALVPIGLVLNGWGDAKYRKDLSTALMLSLVALVIFLLQDNNYHAADHIIGFLFFVWALPIINRAVRYDRITLINWISFFSVFNALLGFYFYYYGIDLSEYRGLNSIIGTDQVIHRVYFESSSLIAIFSVSRIKIKLLKLILLSIVLAYVLFLAKSVMVLALFIANFSAPYIIRRGIAIQIIGAIGFILSLITVIAALDTLRPDLSLSLAVKALQFESIIYNLSSGLIGTGWGGVIFELANNTDQPYQIEMQLPMLLFQIGPVGFILYLLGMFIILRSCSEDFWFAVVRLVIYLLIGFNNPWLFVPSWYLTCALLFKNIEPDPRLSADSPRPGLL